MFVFNPLTTDDAFCWCPTLATCLSVGTIRFEGRFYTSKDGGIGGGGRAHAMHMAAALAGCRTASVGTGRTISHLDIGQWQ